MANSVRSTLYNTNVLPQYVDPFAGMTKYAQQMGDQIRADEKYAAEKAQKDLLFAQAQEDRARMLKDRDSRIEVQKLLSDTLGHLYAKDVGIGDTEAGKAMLGAIGQSVANAQSTVGGTGGINTLTKPQYVTSQVSKNIVENLPRPNPKITFDAKVTSNPEKLPQRGKLEPLEWMNPVTGITNAITAFSPDPAKAKLLETPGMYSVVPGSGVRTLTPAGEAALKKGEIPGKPVLVGLQTDLNSIDFSQAYGKNRQPFADAKGTVQKGDAFFKDTKTGQLVNEKSVTKVLSGIDMKPTQVRTVLGTRTDKVPGLSQAAVAAFKTEGVNPAEVKAAGDNIKAGYASVLSMLPKDNAGRREELRNIALALYADKGLDPNDYDIEKTINSLLPKTEVSEAQKLAMNTIIHGLDKQLDQINKDREFSWAKKVGLHNMAMDDARTKLAQLSHGLQVRKFNEEKGSARNPVQEKIDLEMAMRELDRKYPKSLTPQEAFKYNRDKIKAQQEDEDRKAANDWNPFT
jgi:hypothetical protein